MSFLLDKTFSRKYEQYFSDKLNKRGIFCTPTLMNRDDHGIDIECDNGMLIDVKCYRKPLVVDSFDGVFIETYLPLSGNPGWYEDPKKKTNEYIFVVDCDSYEISYKKAYMMSKMMLKLAVARAEKEGNLKFKKTKSGCGFILPYKYLDIYGGTV